MLRKYFETRRRKYQLATGCSKIGNFMISTAQIFNDDGQITEGEISHQVEHIGGVSRITNKMQLVIEFIIPMFINL
jgi:hypothetical protein